MSSELSSNSPTRSLPSAVTDAGAGAGCSPGAAAGFFGAGSGARSDLRLPSRIVGRVANPRKLATATPGRADRTGVRDRLRHIERTGQTPGRGAGAGAADGDGGAAGAGSAMCRSLTHFAPSSQRHLKQQRGRRRKRSPIRLGNPLQLGASGRSSFSRTCIGSRAGDVAMCGDLRFQRSHTHTTAAATHWTAPPRSAAAQLARSVTLEPNPGVCVSPERQRADELIR